MKLNESSVFFTYLSIGFSIVAIYMFIQGQYLTSLTAVFVAIMSIILLRMGSERNG